MVGEANLVSLPGSQCCLGRHRATGPCCSVLSETMLSSPLLAGLSGQGSPTLI